MRTAPTHSISGCGTCSDRGVIRPRSGSRLRILPATLLLTTVCLTGVAAGQTPAVVTEIVVEQEGARVTDPLVLGLVETRVGTALTAAEVRESITHLMSLGRFEDVQVSQEPTAGGIRARYVLVPLHQVDRVEFRGALGLSEGDLRRTVTERFGNAPSAGRAGDVQGTLEAFYRARGYTAARVAATIEEFHNPDRATMVFDVQSGPRARVGTIEVNGAMGPDRAALLSDVGIKVGDAYDTDALQRGVERHEASLRARGYYQARTTHSVAFDPSGTAVVTLLVDRGPLVTLAFEGDAIPDTDRERLVPIRAEASVDEDLLEDSSRAIEDYLRARGYRDAIASYTRATEGDRLRLTFTVTRGRRYIVGDVTVTGNQIVPMADIQNALPLKAETPFAQDTLDAGVAAIRTLYRSRGFIRPAIRASVAAGEPTTDERRVRVTVAVEEGPQTRIAQVTFVGATAMSDAELRGHIVGVPGRPFSDVEVAADRDKLDQEYRNRGFDAVVITPRVQLRTADTEADVVYTIAEGPQAIVDHIVVIGNRRTRTSTIERELVLKAGQPLGAAALVESQQRLGALGLFRRIQITPIAHPGEPRRDVIVQVEEAPPTTLGYGGGVEGGLRLRPTGESGQAEERFEVAPRGFFEVGRRNLWGKNRAVNLFGRVSLRSRDAVAADGTPLPSNGGYGFNEYRLYATYREPKIWGSGADLLVTGIVNQAVRSSFNFITREARAEAGTRLSSRYSVAGRYSFENTRLFDEHISPEEKPLIDRLFAQVRLSTLSSSVIRDTRDDALYPNHGNFSVVDTELAARAMGSEVGYVKAFVQTFAYVPLPAKRRTILALGARVGAAHGFPRLTTVVDSAGRTVEQRVQDLPASKRFFAGGDTTVRGFSLDRLGDEKTISPSGFPTGGNSEVVLNAELRVAALRNRAEVVGFLDAGNVFQNATDLDFLRLRGAAGFGFRYRSPVGPIRVDVGFNLKRRELVPGQLERPYVLHISLGQAF